MQHQKVACTKHKIQLKASNRISNVYCTFSAQNPYDPPHAKQVHMSFASFGSGLGLGLEAREERTSSEILNSLEMKLGSIYPLHKSNLTISLGQIMSTTSGLSAWLSILHPDYHHRSYYLKNPQKYHGHLYHYPNHHHNLTLS